MTANNKQLPKHTFECQDFECICDYDKKLDSYIRQQQLQLIERVKDEVIGFDDDVHSPLNPESVEDLVITIGENANNKLRKKQRQSLETLKNEVQE